MTGASAPRRCRARLRSSTMRAPSCWAAVPTTMTAPSFRPPDSDFDEWERLGATGWNGAAMAKILAGRITDHDHHLDDRPLPPRPAAASSRRGSRWGLEGSGSSARRSSTGRWAIPRSTRRAACGSRLPWPISTQSPTCQNASRCGRSCMATRLHHREWPRRGGRDHRAAIIRAAHAPSCWRAAPSRRRN